MAMIEPEEINRTHIDFEDEFRLSCNIDFDGADILYDEMNELEFTIKKKEEKITKIEIVNHADNRRNNRNKTKSALF